MNSKITEKIAKEISSTFLSKLEYDGYSSGKRWNGIIKQYYKIVFSIICG